MNEYGSPPLDDETIYCKLCGKPTFMLGTRLCDPCWELQRRIRDDPVLARKLLEMVELEAFNEVLDTTEVSIDP